jgi:hypothetical protein
MPAVIAIILALRHVARRVALAIVNVGHDALGGTVARTKLFRRHAPGHSICEALDCAGEQVVVAAHGDFIRCPAGVVHGACVGARLEELESTLPEIVAVLCCKVQRTLPRLKTGKID